MLARLHDRHHHGLGDKLRWLPCNFSVHVSRGWTGRSEPKRKLPMRTPASHMSRARGAPAAARSAGRPGAFSSVPRAAARRAARERPSASVNLVCSLYPAPWVARPRVARGRLELAGRRGSGTAIRSYIDATTEEIPRIIFIRRSHVHHVDPHQHTPTVPW